jgi:hypothetical protein
MSWKIMTDGRELKTADDINALKYDHEIRHIELVLDRQHFDRERVDRRVVQIGSGRAGHLRYKLQDALECGVITFDLLRQLSVWSGKHSDYENTNAVTRLLFYGEELTRFAADRDTKQLAHNYREIFLPWLIRVLERQSAAQ